MQKRLGLREKKESGGGRGRGHWFSSSSPISELGPFPLEYHHTLGHWEDGDHSQDSFKSRTVVAFFYACQPTICSLFLLSVTREPRAGHLRLEAPVEAQTGRGRAGSLIKARSTEQMGH